MCNQLSNAIKGSTAQEAEIRTALMIGAKLDDNGHPAGINQSIIMRFLATLEKLKIPASAELRAFQNVNASPAPTNTLKAIDLNLDAGGVDFYTYNKGDTPPDALIFCGIPQYPDDHDINILNNGKSESYLGGLFSNSAHHHDTDNWYNLRKKLEELSPNLIYFSGGSDCLSWQEAIGPEFVALKGPELDRGVLISKKYLHKIEAYLLSVESSLIDVAFTAGDANVFNSNRSTGELTLHYDSNYNAQEALPQAL